MTHRHCINVRRPSVRGTNDGKGAKSIKPHLTSAATVTTAEKVYAKLTSLAT